MFRNTVLTFILSLLLISTGCNPHSKSKVTVPSEAEENIFMLVYTPNYEGRYHEAITTADSIMATCQMSDSLKAFIMIERDVALINMGEVEAGYNFADTLISFGKETGINEAVLQGLTAKGLVYRRSNRLDSAIAMYSEALELAVQDRNAEWEQAIADYLAVAYTEANRIAEGHRFAIRALHIAEETADTASILHSASTLASVLAKSKDFNGTISELRPYRQMFEKASPSIKIKFLTPLFHSYLGLDSVAKAEQVLTEAEQAAEGFPKEHFQSIILRLCRAKLHKARKQYDKEYAIYLEVDSIGTIGRQSEDLMLEKTLSLSNMGRNEEAFAMMGDAYATLDSIRNSDLQQELSDLSVRYDTLTKQIEIERLGRQWWIMVYIISVCAVAIALIIALFVYYRNRSRRRLARERREQYLNGLEEERGRMARELHDDIAGQLLGLQWELQARNDNEAADRIGAIGRQVRTLSHELMPPRFAELTFCQLLIDFARKFNETHNNVDMSVTDEGSFDWDSLPVRYSYELYRIMQESVTNALKHATPSRIKITLSGDGKFSITISNDGVNGSVDTTCSGAGSTTIKTRAESIGCDTEAHVSNGSYRLDIRQR